MNELEPNKKTAKKQGLLGIYLHTCAWEYDVSQKKY
jgi:hypothetical protein